MKYSSSSYYLNSIFVLVSYLLIIASTIILLSIKKTSKNFSIEILDERLSKGEISIEEYQNLNRVLKESR